MGTHSGGRPPFVPGLSGREAAAGSAPEPGLAWLPKAPRSSGWLPAAPAGGPLQRSRGAAPLCRCGLQCALAAATHGLLNFKQQRDGRNARMNGQNAPPGSLTFCAFCMLCLAERNWCFPVSSRSGGAPRCTLGCVLVLLQLWGQVQHRAPRCVNPGRPLQMPSVSSTGISSLIPSVVPFIGLFLLYCHHLSWTLV